MSVTPVPSALGPALRQIDPAQQVARQKHLGLRYQHQRANGDRADSWSLHVSPHVRADSWLHLATDNQRLALSVRPGEEAPMIGQRHWHDYAGDARLMAWSVQHESLIAALQRLLDRRLTPLEFAQSPTDVDERLAGPVVDFELTDESGKSTWRGSLAMTSALCDELLGDAVSTPIDRLHKQWLGVPIPVALRARGPTMALDIVRGCRTGDVIVLGQHRTVLASLIAVHRDGTAVPARCSVNDQDVTLSAGVPASWLQESSTKEQSTMSEKGETAEERTLATSIPVRLSIQTAAVDVTINDLEQLGSGVILPLNVPVTGANVTILANGAPIGDGELVAAGDKLGVCIGRWRPDGL